MAFDDQPLLHAFAPTIEVDGMSYPLLARNLEKMRVQEALGGLSSLELVFADTVTRGDGSSGYAAGVGSPLQLGAGIRLFGGPHEVGAAELFDGQITGIEAEVREAGPPVFAVLAEDRLFPLRRSRRTRLYEAMSLADVVADIADHHGLTPQVREGVNRTTRNWMQADETDLAFLRRALARWDCDMQVVGDRLQVGRVAMDQRTLVRLEMGRALKYARMTADIAEQVSAVTLGSFDPAAGEIVSAGEDAVGFGPGQGKTGADVLSEKFSAVIMHQGRHGPLTDPDGDALAVIEGQRRARGFVQVRGCSEGNAELRVGSWIELVGVNPMFANQYAVREAVHRWDTRDGYTTDFVAESAYLGEAA